MERYRFSHCRRPLPAALMQKLGVPLPEGERAVLHDELAWEEIQVCIYRQRWRAQPSAACGVLLGAELHATAGTKGPSSPGPPSLARLSPCARLDLSRLQWGPTGVSVRGQLFPLVRIHFTIQTGKPGAAPAAAVPAAPAAAAPAAAQ